MKRLVIVIIIFLLLSGCTKNTLEDKVLANDWNCDTTQCDIVVNIEGSSTTIIFDRNSTLFGITPGIDSEFDYVSYEYTSGAVMLYFYDSNPNIACIYEDNKVLCEDTINNETEEYLNNLFIELENVLE